MPVYEYTALDKEGRQISGLIDAESPAAARQKIRGQDQYPIGLAGADQAAFSLKRLMRSGPAFRQKRQIPLFTRQLATLLSAGIPLVPALNGLIEQGDDPALGIVLAGLREAVQEGQPLSAALAGHPGLFSPIFINMVRAGEASGTLPLVLTQLADFGEREQGLQSRIRAALLYPLFLALSGAAMLVLLLTVVLPKITAVFAESEQALPLATTLLMQLSAGLRHFWLPLLVVLAALGCGLHRFLKSEAGKRRWHRLQLRLPFVGPLRKKQAAARFARALASLVHAGVPLVDALAIVSNLSGNVLIGEGIRAACGTLEKGQSLAAHFRSQDWCPPMLTQMMAVGEQSGALDELLAKAAEHLERELEAKIMGLTTLIEPVMILVMGLVVAFLVAAVLLPVFEMNQLVH